MIAFQHSLTLVKIIQAKAVCNSTWNADTFPLTPWSTVFDKPLLLS